MTLLMTSFGGPRSRICLSQRYAALSIHSSHAQSPRLISSTSSRLESEQKLDYNDIFEHVAPRVVRRSRTSAMQSSWNQDSPPSRRREIGTMGHDSELIADSYPPSYSRRNPLSRAAASDDPFARTTGTKDRFKPAGVHDQDLQRANRDTRQTFATPIVRKVGFGKMFDDSGPRESSNWNNGIQNRCEQRGGARYGAERHSWEPSNQRSSFPIRQVKQGVFSSIQEDESRKYGGRLRGTFVRDLEEKAEATQPGPWSRSAEASTDASIDAPKSDRVSHLLERVTERFGGRSKGRDRDRGRAQLRRNKDADEEQRYRETEDRKAVKKARKAEKLKTPQDATAAAISRRAQLHIPPHISLANLATMLDMRFEAFTVKLEELGFSELSHDHTFSAETAGLVASEFGYDPVYGEATDTLVAAHLPEDKSVLPSRPPVVTIMGHVDHGKTTLLDFLRQSSVAANEHGGITQHIGAFSVPLSSGKNITFLDTPGHAAFLTMRQRGADVTDIVVLVVAADDSVMPQTIEAIKHAKNAKVPIIVAINKIDKPEANADRVKQDLARNGIELEEFGGDTQVVCVSGKTGTGMKDLEESISTLSEILDHRAPSDGTVEGWLLESSTKEHGKVATVLVRRGTLQAGDIIVAGCTWARVRTLRDAAGTVVPSAKPGFAVEIDGWKDRPVPGDEVLQAKDEQHAAAVVHIRNANVESVKLAKDMEAINETRRLQREANTQQTEDGEPAPAPVEPTSPRDVPFIVKADVVGSVEAVINLISGLGNSQIRTNVISSGAGNVTQSDVDLSISSGAIILAFNTDYEPRVLRMAQMHQVDIISHSVIYHVADDVNSRLAKMLPPKIIQRVMGEAEVSKTFSIRLSGKKKLLVAGCKVRNGTVSRNAKVRVLRNGETIYDGTLSSLKNNKKDVTEMKKDTECGLSFSDWEDFFPGDQIQCYSETHEVATL